MKRPNLPASMPCSRSIGSSVPRAVVVNPMATGRNAWTKPMAARPPTTSTAIAVLITQAITACFPAFSRSNAGSSSYPARRNRKPSPNPAISWISSDRANPRTWGPMRMPPRIRNNTCGGRPGISREMIGAMAATVITSSSDHSEVVLTCRPSDLRGGPSHLTPTPGSPRHGPLRNHPTRINGGLGEPSPAPDAALTPATTRA